jgi:hypothetical protein
MKKSRFTESQVVAIALLLCLAGCAADPGRRPSVSSSEGTPYVGVFTGEYVDGKPLFRFPPIRVVGTRDGSGRISAE